MSGSSDEIAAEAFRSLQAKALSNHDGNTHNLLVVYGTESFMRRLAISPYANNLVLKGGMLMAANCIRQMTRDGDFSAHGLDNDMNFVARIVGEILELTPDPYDGITFNADSVRTEIMREDDDYHGVRCRATASLGKAVIPLALDISFGDAGTAEQITIRSLIELPDVSVLAYPLALNLAEKIVTAMQRGAANTRDRDFADIWVASRLQSLDAGPLREHIVSVAETRDQPLIPMKQALDQIPDRQATYSAMVERMSYMTLPPESWDALLKGVIRFADPLIDDGEGNLIRWSPDREAWTS